MLYIMNSNFFYIWKVYLIYFGWYVFCKWMKMKLFKVVSGKMNMIRVWRGVDDGVDLNECIF